MWTATGQYADGRWKMVYNVLDPMKKLPDIAVGREIPNNLTRLGLFFCIDGKGDEPSEGQEEVEQ